MNAFKAGVLLLVALFLASCNKTPQHLKVIPKDVTAAAAVDLKQIATKSVELKDFFSMDMLKKISGNDSTVEKIKNSGIDFTSPGYIFGDGPKGEAKAYVAISFAVSDASKLESTLKEAKKGVEVKEEGDYKYVADNSMVIFFNDKMGLFMASEGETDKIKSFAASILATTEENSLLKTNDKFSDLIKKGNDVGIFVNYERAMDLAKASNPFMPINFNYKETYMVAGINFENGQIATDYTMYSNKEMAEKYKDAYRANVSSDVQDATPGNVVAGMSIAINLKSVVSMLKDAKMIDENVDASIAMMLGTGFNLEYLLSTFSGDIVATANGLRTKDGMKYDFMTGNMVPSKEPAVDFAVSFGILDEAKLQTLLDTLSGKGMLQKSEGYYNIMGKFFVQKKKGALVIAGEEAFAKEYVSGKYAKLDGRAKELFSSNSAAFVADFSKVPGDVLDLISPQAKDYVSKMPLAGFEAYAPKPDGEVSTGKFLILFKDKDKNALLSVQQMIKDSEKYFPAPSSRSYEDVPADSAAYPVDTVAVAPEIMEEPME